MTVEQEKELLAFLATLGFTGNNLAEDIHANTEKNVSVFTVKDSKYFGSDLMKFDLQFRRDQQFDAYRLEKYKATLQQPVKIDHQIINGIDSEDLEARMKAVDWDGYFRPGSYYGVREREEIKLIISNLWQLTSSPNIDGLDIQTKLQFKYWPENKWDDATNNLKADYQNSRWFMPSEFEFCNANLAYYTITGLTDDVHEQMSPLKFEEWPGVDVYPILEEFLSDNPDHFDFKCSRNEPDGLVEFSVPVKKVDDWFHPCPYTATLTPYPPIEHGVYNGIDTAHLEELMQKINWRNDAELFIFHEDSEPEFLPKVGDVQEQMYRLSQDMAGADIADKLQVKYWIDVTFFEDMLQQSAWDYLASLPKIEQVFRVDTDAKMAFNLLCERPVLQMESGKMYYPDQDTWIKLNLQRTEDNGLHPVETIKGFSIQEMEDILKMFPIPANEYYRVRNSLVRGDVTPVKLENEQKIFMSANPELHTVNLYSETMRPVYTNIHLDPDWKPPQQHQQAVEEAQRQKAANKFQTGKPFRRHRGRGL